MENAQQLFQAGRLKEAVQALSVELRNHPADTRRRTFLFELLCFSGEYDRAEKQLDLLAEASPNSEMGALLYRSALHAERTRQDLFQRKEFPKPSGEASTGGETTSGTLNGKPFQTIADSDTRIGPRLEVFAGGNYLWISFEHLASVQIQPPRRLRDLLWTPAVVRAGPALKDTELGEVLLPVLSPFAWQHSDEAVRLGRMTVWEEDESGAAVPIGQKMLLVDGEEFPLLEVRQLEFNLPQGTV
ncbi:MAG TPA: type VI secretion system accessory protein TagJ [Terriglobia bacterium]|nr:type VI secretion system accessory protein TagJ [Terriglobia bacterium]